MALSPEYQATLQRFNSEVTRFAKELVPAQLVLFHKKIALEALTRVVQKTPVDTGRARANWQTTLNSPSETVINVDVDESDFEATGKNKKAKDRSKKRAVSRATKDFAIQRGMEVIKTIQPYSQIHITNNVHYIVYLEEGSSKQAPKGMVMVTIQELLQMFQ